MRRGRSARSSRPRPAADPDVDDRAIGAAAGGAAAGGVPALVGGVLALLLLAAFAAAAALRRAEREARLERIRQLTDTVAANPRELDALPSWPTCTWPAAAPRTCSAAAASAWSCCATRPRRAATPISA